MKWDVLAVDLDTNKVRVLGANLSDESADAVVNMALIRHGVDEEFFVSCESGCYKTGDVWEVAK